MEVFINAPDPGFSGTFTAAEYAAVAEYHRDTPMTPLRRVGAVLVKDESQRMGLNAFKGVGVSYAIDRLLATGTIRPGALLLCASAGNHGRAVARIGRSRGCAVKVFMSETATPARQEAIRSEGAEVVLVRGGYDEAVDSLKQEARRLGGTIVSDTAWEGYEEIPRLIMAGYTRIADEAKTQWSSPPDAVFVQAGVGSLAAAMVSWFCAQVDIPRPKLVCVEPLEANPLMQSARAKQRVRAALAATVMDGLNCAEASTVAVPILNRGCDAFVAIGDDVVQAAMERLGEAGISAGPSGAAGFAAAVAVPSLVSSGSTVLVINTERSH